MLVKILVQNFSVQKDSSGEKNVGQKYLGSNIYKGQKNIGSRLKELGQKKSCFPKKFCPKTIWSKISGSKRFFGEKILVQKC